MATTIPAKGISLRGSAAREDDLKPGSSSGILLKLGDKTLEDLKKASNTKDVLSLVTGNAPKLRIGSKTIDLNISSDAFRNELFTCTTGQAATDFNFTGLISHRAEPKTSELKPDQDTSGTDAALAALQSSLASYEQEKQSKQANITGSVLPTPKNRFDAARKEKLDKKSLKPSMNNQSRPGSPSLSAAATPKLGPAPTSMPASESEAKMQAMKTPVIHLLAMGPTTRDDIMRSTHIPKDDLEVILQRIGKNVEGKWQMSDRAYKDLEVWKFGYPTQKDRQAAIDNAVRAYDRLRLGKEDRLWQMLLPKKDRGKGIVLSKLDLNGGQVNRGLTPHYQPSPMPHLDGAADSKAASTANTPKLGALTPRTAGSKGDVMKRLLSKNPQKARAAEEAKEKKRKEKEAAASDREGAKPAKKQATKKANVKSAEIVHSSDEESDEEGELKQSTNSQAGANPETAKTTTKSRPKAVTTTSSSDSSDAPLKSTVKAKANASNTKSKDSPAAKASKPDVDGKSTPKTTTTNGLSAPNSQQKSQRSPQKPDSKPSVPSPLGAARPRVASDVSDGGAVGVQKVKHGAETPKGLGITSSSRPRHDTMTSNGSNASEKPTKERTTSDKRNMTPKLPNGDGNSSKVNGTAKRKAEDSPAQSKDSAPAAKHRKTGSGSSQSQNSHSSTAKASNDTARTSPDIPIDSGSDSAEAVIDSITYGQGVNLAEKFKDTYYPAYVKLYDSQAEMEARGEKVSKEERERLWAMHKRLEQMKREIVIASKREE